MYKVSFLYRIRESCHAQARLGAHLLRKSWAPITLLSCVLLSSHPLGFENMRCCPTVDLFPCDLGSSLGDQSIDAGTRSWQLQVEHRSSSGHRSFTPPSLSRFPTQSDHQESVDAGGLKSVRKLRRMLTNI